MMRTGRPVTIANHGMVTSPHYLASQAGLQILQQGGNAVDAAIATAATLGVVMPHQTSMGGDAFWLIYKTDTGQLHALNASGRSSYALSHSILREMGLPSVPILGPLPVTVPGVVDGWCTSLEAHGTLPLTTLLQPAIDYAENGFPINKDLANVIQQEKDTLDKFSEWRKIFLKDGRAPAVGDRLVQKELGATLQAIATGGREVCYRGEIADKIVKCVQRQGGYLTWRDLADHHSDWVESLSTSYRGYTVYELPPNSRGAIVLTALNILEGIDISSLGLLSPLVAHTLLEAYRLAKEHVESACGDPDFGSSSLPLAKLLSKEFADHLRAQMSLNQPIEFTPETASDTVYLAVVDSAGNAVSLIESIYYNFGSGLVVEDAGFSLQNRGAHFSLDPNHPNRLEPHKRTLHTLMPAMVFKGDQPWLVFGTMGGAGQAQTQLQLLTHLIDFGLNIQQAIEAPRWVKGGTLIGEVIEALRIENRFPAETLQKLADYGHRLAFLGDWSDRTGHAQAILIDQARKVFHGGADPRSEGVAAGW